MILITRPVNARRSRPGFTLVELLVVVVIIAVLASFLVPAVWNAITSAEEGKIKVEVALLASAVEAYKAEYGAYPPDFNDHDLVWKHINRIFPRQTDFASVAALPVLSEAQALVFWLRGFSPDPQRPFTGAGDRTPMFDFDRLQLSAELDSNDPYPMYGPRSGLETPYAYFSKTYVGKSYSVSGAQTGTARPYLLDDGTTYAAEGKFQIISAGQDGHYGVGGGQYPSGMGYAAGDRDNVVNFSQGATLENDRP